MNISNVQQVQESTGGNYPVYVGLENFFVTAVNPTLKELQDMGIPATEEPVYISKLERDGEKVDSFSIRIFLDNQDASNPIKTSVNYTVLKSHRISTSGKYQVINSYGGSTWLTEEEITGKTPVPSNMQWYVMDGVKKAYIGEEELIKFIKALRNLPNINNTVTDSAEKAKGIAILEQKDLDKLFAGNFTDIRNVILNSTTASADKCKVGFLLGARNTDSGTKQGLFSRTPLKAYVKATEKADYLVKEVKDAQDNGALSTTIFDLTDLKLKEYKQEDIEQLQPQENDDLPF